MAHGINEYLAERDNDLEFLFDDEWFNKSLNIIDERLENTKKVLDKIIEM